MGVFGATGAQGAVGLLDHLGRIAHEYDIAKVQRLRQFQRAKQRQPLGVAVGAMPQIVEHMRHATHHYSGLDAPGIGTAATIKKSAPIVAQHLVDVIAGRAPGQKFDGYTSCPLIVKEGSAMLIEYDYEGRLTPSLPLIEPLQARYFAWLMKYRILKPAYFQSISRRRSTRGGRRCSKSC